MTDGDWSDLPRENVVSVFADGETVEVSYRVGDGVVVERVAYRGFLTTSEAAVAQAPALHDIADVEVLTGTGLKFLVRPKEGQTMEELREWLACHSTELISRSLKYDIPEPREAFMLDSGLRYFGGLSDAEIRVAYVSIVVGCESRAALRYDFNDPANVIVSAAVSCAGKEYAFGGDENTVVAELYDCFERLDCDVVVGFQLASRGLHHLSAATDRAVRVRDHNVAARAERLVYPNMSILDLELLCGHGTTKKRRTPRDLQELAERWGVDFPGAMSLREALRLLGNPQKAKAAALAAVRVTRLLGEQHIGGAIELARTMPRTLDDIVHAREGDCLASKMRETYVAQGHALPEQAPVNLDESEGGLFETPARGHFADVGHLDLVSAYATVIADRGLASTSDVLLAFPSIVREWLAARQQALRAAQECEAAGDTAGLFRQRAIADRYKRLLVTAYGLSGSTYFRFADRALMAEIAATVREVAVVMCESVERAGGQVLCVEADGLYYNGAGTVELDHAAVRASVEADVRVASRIEVFQLRLTGPYRAAFFTSRLRLLSDGTRKGWKAGNLSPFVLDVREKVAVALVDDDHKEAARVTKAAFQAIRERSVPAVELAQPFVVDAPPALSIGSPNFDRSEMDAALTAKAVHGETVHVVKIRREEQLAWTAVAPDGDEPEYDVAWAHAQLRSALAHFDQLINDVLSGDVINRIASTVRKRASGVAHTRLTAGVKTDGKITASCFVEYADVGAEAAFVAEHDDAHGLVLGFFGNPTQKADMSSRVRVGDFSMELEDKVDGDRPLVAAKACVGALEAMGVDVESDVRLMFNGVRSIVLRVRQDALGVQNCVELPMLYRRFAKRLWELARPAVNYDGVPYDSERYNSVASYRLTGCAHTKNGFRATWFSVADLRGANTLAELERLPQAVPMRPFGAQGPVVGLRLFFDEVTVGLARTATHDENSRTRKPKTIARYQREEKKRKLRLNVISEQEDPPCVEKLLERVDRGDSIGFGPLSKVIYELRLRGADRRVIAERLASGEGGPSRYESRLVIKSDGPDLLDSLWKDDVEATYYKNCSNESAKELCDFANCYKSRQPQVFSDEDSPTYDEGRKLAYSVTGSLVVPDVPAIMACEVPPRSGKSTQLAKIAIRLAELGDRVLIVAPTHTALAQIGKYLLDVKSTKPALAVELLGRGPKREHCAPEYQKRVSCGGCPKHGVLISGGGQRRSNPNLRKIRVGRRRVVTADVCHELAGDLCGRTVSHHLAKRAPIVLATVAHLRNDRWANMVRSEAFTVVLIDESDALFDELANGTDRLVLSTSRQSVEAPLSAHCAMNCDECHMDYTPSPSLDTWRGARQLKVVSEHRSSEVLFEGLEAGMRVLDADPSIAPHIDVDALRENLTSLSKVLIPHDLVRRGHDVSPQLYNAHLSARAVDGAYEADASVVEEGDRVSFVPLRRCVSAEAPSAYNEQQQWRRDLRDDDNPAARNVQVAGVADTADFLDHAAQTGGGALVVPRSRPGTWANWMNGCSVELRIVDQRAVDRLRQYLSARRTLMVSGTQPDSDLLRALFPGIEVKKLPVPLHRDMTIFIHTVPNTRRADSFLPRRFEAEQMLALVKELARVVQEQKGRKISIRVFARKRREQEKMLELAEGLASSGIEVIGGKTEATARAWASIAFDYVRSSESRAVDHDVDLLVIFGSGRPAYDGYHGFSEVLAKAGTPVSVEMLAEDSRIRAVVQALNRSAALPGRRAVAVINDLTVADMPSWLHHRVISTDRLYRTIEGVEPGDVVDAQIATFAQAIYNSLSPRMEPPTREEVLSWSKTASGAIGSRARQANEKRVTAMIAKARAGADLTVSDSVGATTEWGLMLRWLAKRGVMEVVLKQRVETFVFTTEGLQHLKGMFI